MIKLILHIIMNPFVLVEKLAYLIELQKMNYDTRLHIVFQHGMEEKTYVMHYHPLLLCYFYVDMPIFNGNVVFSHMET